MFCVSSNVIGFILLLRDVCDDVLNVHLYE